MSKKKNIFATMSDTNLLLVITCAIFIVMTAVAIIAFPKDFGKAQSFLDILGNNAALIVTSVGMSIVMISGSIDISVGGVVALVASSCSVLIQRQGGNTFTAILLSLAIGLSFGIVQGYLVAYLDIQPFIVSLAGMFFARGMTTIVGGDNPTFNIDPSEFAAGSADQARVQAFMDFKDFKIVLPGLGYTNANGAYIDAKIMPGVIIALVIVIALFLVMGFNKFGRHVYAVGGNKQSAMMLGINVKSTKFFAHVICGVLAGVAGFLFLLNTGGASPAAATGMEMNAIASSIMGGTMLTGGVGNMFGTLLGVVSLNIIKNMVVSFKFFQDPWWPQIIIGAMLGLFLVIQSVVMSIKSKAKK